MGTWGTGYFENDDAQDWLEDFMNNGSLEFIQYTLVEAIEEEYIEEPIGSNTIAAAEVVALINGKGRDNTIDELSKWINNNKPMNDTLLLKLARKAINRIQNESELQELWDESEDAKEWKERIKDLENRLK